MFEINGTRITNEVHWEGRRWWMMECRLPNGYTGGKYCPMRPIEDGDEMRAVVETELILEVSC